MFLLDTPILVELRAAHDPAADRRRVLWATRVPRERLFLSAVSVVEVEGTASRAGASGKAGSADWRTWIDTRLPPAFKGHILPVDAAVARRRGLPPLPDTPNAPVATNATEHGLTLVTRARAAYRGARVRLLDPAAQATDVPVANVEDDRRSAGRAGLAWLRDLFIRG